MLLRLPSRAIVTSFTIMAIAPGCGGTSPTAPTSPPQPALTVSSITPNTGSTVFTGMVTIRGTGFISGAMVTLGGAATSVSVVNSTTITATAPAHDVGTVDVLVVNPGGQSARLAGAFTYVDGTYTLAPSQHTVAPGGELSISWTAPRGSVWDWIGLFKLGDPSTNYESGWWKYTDGARSGTFTLSAPSQPGQYEFRYLLDDGFVDTVRSSPVTVR